MRPAPGTPPELYHLKTDPGEKENVAAQNPDIVAKIEAYLKTARTESDRWPLRTAQEETAWRKANPNADKEPN